MYYYLCFNNKNSFIINNNNDNNNSTVYYTRNKINRNCDILGMIKYGETQIKKQMFCDSPSGHPVF